MNEERLAELEIKVSYQEDALNALNDVIYQQQTRIDALEALLAQYRQYFDNAVNEPPGHSSQDEKPPHY
jgi:SlyX protein